MASGKDPEIIKTDVPARLDALPWGRFHTLVVTALGGIAAPSVFAALIGSGSRTNVFVGYLFGATLPVAAGLVQAKWGVAAERKSLE